MLLSSCGQPKKNHGESTLRAPLLNECREAAINFQDTSTKYGDVKFQIVDFDLITPAYSEVTGYIELRSSVGDKSSLERVINALFIECYPESSTTVSLEDGELGELLNENLELGAPKNHLVYDHKNKDVKVFINQRYILGY